MNVREIADGLQKAQFNENTTVLVYHSKISDLTISRDVFRIHGILWNRTAKRRTALPTLPILRPYLSRIKKFVNGRKFPLPL